MAKVALLLFWDRASRVPLALCLKCSQGWLWTPALPASTSPVVGQQAYWSYHSTMPKLKRAISLWQSLIMQPSLGLNSWSSRLSFLNCPKNHPIWHKMIPQKIVKSSLLDITGCFTFAITFLWCPLLESHFPRVRLVPTLDFKSRVRWTLLYLVFICVFRGSVSRCTHISNDYIFLVNWNLTITECRHCL